MNKKILNVVSVYFSIPFFFGEQLSYFKKKGYEIHIICSPSDKLKNYSKIHQFKYYEVPILRKFSIIKDIKAVINVYKYIKKNEIQTVSGHTAKGSLIAMLAAYLARTPKRLYFRHGFYYETSTGLKKHLMLNIDRFSSMLSTKVIGVSPYVIEKSVELKLTKKEKLTLLNVGSCNGVDTKIKFNPNLINQAKLKNLKAKLKIKDSDFIIGYTGRLVKDKGLIELVDSFKILTKKYKTIKLLLIGPKEERNSVPIDTLNYIDTENNIITTGMIDSSIEYFYALMSCLVLPTYREGLGTSLLEAASMGVPVLTTSHTGSRDAMKNEFNGFYIKLNGDDIANKIEYYINDKNLRLKHGNNGRNFIINNFEQELIWKEIENKLYKI